MAIRESLAAQSGPESIDHSPLGDKAFSIAGGSSHHRRLYTHVDYFRIADHLSGVAHNFPEPGSWLNEEITWRGMNGAE
jgi:hypothetical protein